MMKKSPRAMAVVTALVMLALAAKAAPWIMGAFKALVIGLATLFIARLYRAKASNKAKHRCAVPVVAPLLKEERQDWSAWEAPAILRKRGMSMAELHAMIQGKWIVAKPADTGDPAPTPARQQMAIPAHLMAVS